MLPVDRKPAGQGMHLGTNRCDVRFIVGVIEHVGDEVCSGTGLVVFEAARGHGRCANANATGDHGFFRVVGDGVFIDGHVSVA